MVRDVGGGLLSLPIVAQGRKSAYRAQYKPLFVPEADLSWDNIDSFLPCASVSSGSLLWQR